MTKNDQRPREQRYKKRFGVDWKPIPSIYSELAAVQIGCDDIEVAKKYFKFLNDSSAINLSVNTIAPDPATGFAFHLKQVNSKDIFEKLKAHKAFAEKPA